MTSVDVATNPSQLNTDAATLFFLVFPPNSRIQMCVEMDLMHLQIDNP